MTRAATTRLLLARHGETDSNVEGRSQGRRDVPLNERGRRQAAALAELVASYSPSAVYSSASARARGTAAPIAEALGLEVTVDERLFELDQGDLDGLTPREMMERAPDFLRRWRDEDPTDLCMPGGESMGEAQRRMLDAVEAMAGAHPGQTVVAVSHNLALKALLCHALGAPLAAFRRFRTDVASLAVVDVHEGGGLTVVRLNERCHLDGEDGGV